LLLRGSVKLLFAVAVLSLFSFAQSFTRAEYAVGAQPYGVASADFNRDTVADLAVTNQGNNSVSILLGRGDGTFSAASNVSVGPAPTEVVTADFNRDGSPDLAIANSQGVSLTVLLGNGDGTFRRSDMQAGGAQVSITAADFNGDAAPDLAIAANGLVQILLGNGDGSFLPASSLATHVPAKQVRAADLNHDGVVDLAIGACCQGTDVTYGAFYAAAGNGDGTLAIRSSSNQSDGAKLTVADVTGDGLADMIMPYVGCHTPCDGVEIATNAGNFNFTRFGGGGDDGGLNYGGRGPAAVGNFSGNGRVQVASSAAPGSNNAGNGYDKVLIWDVGADGKFTSQHDYVIGINTGLWGMTSADFNRDGKDDIAIVERNTGRVAVLLSGDAPQAFDLSIQFSPQTVSAGSTAQYGFTLEATNGTLPTTQLSCSGLPTGTACSFDAPASGAMANGFLRISTTPRSAAWLQHNLGWLALTLPFGLVAIPNRGRKPMLILLLMIALAVMVEVGCAGAGNNLTQASGAATSVGNNSGEAGSIGSGDSSSNGNPGAGNDPTPTAGPTPAGTYSVTVAATGAGITRTRVITLVVQ
jgi:hypothetical protein